MKKHSKCVKFVYVMACYVGSPTAVEAGKMDAKNYGD